MRNKKRRVMTSSNKTFGGKEKKGIIFICRADVGRVVFRLFGVRKNNVLGNLLLYRFRFVLFNTHVPKRGTFSQPNGNYVRFVFVEICRRANSI